MAPSQLVAAQPNLHKGKRYLRPHGMAHQNHVFEIFSVEIGRDVERSALHHIGQPLRRLSSAAKSVQGYDVIVPVRLLRNGGAVDRTRRGETGNIDHAGAVVRAGTLNHDPVGG